jgi:hypothetical protein
MRSQVQVLAGPPAIVAAQSAVGSKPGTLAGCLGRAGAARPSPPPSPAAPPGPSTRRQAPQQPRIVVAHSSRGGQPRGRCGNLALRPPSVPSRSRRRRALRMPAWPAQEANVKPGPPPAPDPARVRHRQPPTMRHLGGVARVRACSAVDRAAPRRGSPPELDPFLWRRLPAASTWSPPPPPEVGRDGRVRTDGGGQQPAGRRTGGHRTGWTLDALDTRRPDTGRLDRRTRTTEPLSGHHMVDADRRRRHGRHPGPADHGDNARPLDVGWTLRRAAAVWATNQPGQLSSKDHQDGPGHRRDRQLQVLRRRQAGASAHCCPQKISGRE